MLKHFFLPKFRTLHHTKTKNQTKPKQKNSQPKPGQNFCSSLILQDFQVPIYWKYLSAIVNSTSFISEKKKKIEILRKHSEKKLQLKKIFQNNEIIKAFFNFLFWDVNLWLLFPHIMMFPNPVILLTFAFMHNLFLIFS